MIANSKLIVNLDSIKYNLLKIKTMQNPYTMVLAMVKANAYGLGSVEVSKYIEKNELAQFLGVAYLNEAKKLRDAGVKLPIMVLGVCLKEEIYDTVRLDNVIPSITSYKYAEDLNIACNKAWKVKKVNIEIDTGMNRSGIGYKDAVEIITRISKLDNIQIYGVYTHLSSADSNVDYTTLQLERFNKIIDELKTREIEIPVVHVCSSSGCTYIKDKRYNMIRPGIMMYGYYPSEILKSRITLKPTCTLESRIYHIHSAYKGEGIGYNETKIAEEPMKIASVSIGYADGLRRELSNKGECIINDTRCKIVGNICMDTCMIDVSDLSDVSIGDKVIFFNEDNDISLDEVAKACNTINYEILTQIGNRVIREYRE